MEALTRTISRWTTEQLVAEVMWRTGSDAPSLALLETKIIRARLAACDRGFAEATQAEPTTVPDLPGVHGIVEMGLDDGGEKAPPLAAPGHEVDPATTDAHTHDHTHRRLASAKFAAHEHYHVHPDDLKADATLNGHTHARAHDRLPWEDRDSA